MILSAAADLAPAVIPFKEPDTEEKDSANDVTQTMSSTLPMVAVRILYALHTNRLLLSMNRCLQGTSESIRREVWLSRLIGWISIG